MDKNVHYKIINPDQKRRPAINKVWSQKCNILPEGMPHKLINQKRQVKYMVDLLNEEIKKYQRKKDLNRLRRSRKWYLLPRRRIYIPPREKNVAKNRKKCELYKRINYGYNKNEWTIFRRKNKKNFYENTTNEKKGRLWI